MERAATDDIEAGHVLDENVSEEGCDLTLVHQLLAMTPTERAYALKSAANNLLRARALAHRV